MPCEYFEIFRYVKEEEFWHWIRLEPIYHSVIYVLGKKNLARVLCMFLHLDPKCGFLSKCHLIQEIEFFCARSSIRSFLGAFPIVRFTPWNQYMPYMKKTRINKKDLNLNGFFSQLTLIFELTVVHTACYRLHRKKETLNVSKTQKHMLPRTAHYNYRSVLYVYE